MRHIKPPARARPAPGTSEPTDSTPRAAEATRRAPAGVVRFVDLPAHLSGAAVSDTSVERRADVAPKTIAVTGRSITRGRRRRVPILAMVMTMMLSLVAANPASAAEYRVQPGDSLWSIAETHATTVATLRELNSLDGNTLQVGATLRVPNPPYEGPTIEHEVIAGEAVSVIAETYGVSVQAILDLNDLDNANTIRVGAVLAIPSLTRDKGDRTTITVSHKVATGEVLGTIAADYDVTVATIMSANGLANPDHIRVGDVLQIPNVIPRNEVERLTAIFERWAEANDIPSDLVKAVAWQESHWREDAISSAGAMGIGQIMPGTARFVSEDLIGIDGLDPWDAEDNIRMSARLLDYLLEETGGDLEMALGSYYQGLGSVRQRGFYEDTRAYVDSVLVYIDRFAAGELPPQ